MKMRGDNMFYDEHGNRIDEDCDEDNDHLFVDESDDDLHSACDDNDCQFNKNGYCIAGENDCCDD